MIRLHAPRPGVRRALSLRLAVLVLAFAVTASIPPQTAAARSMGGQSAAACGSDFCGELDAAGTSWAQHSLSLTAGVATTITVDWSVAAADLNAGLKLPDGRWTGWTAGKKPGVISVTPAATGTYIVGIKARSGAAAYTVTVAAGGGTAPPPSTPGCSSDYCRSGAVDATGKKFAAFPIAVSTTGRITARLDWSTVGADLNLGLKNPAGTWVKWATSKTARPEVLEFDATVTGQWTVAVVAKSGASSFDLAVDVGGATAADFATIGDLAFVDSNGDGLRQSGEAGLAGVRFAALSSGKEVAVALSDATGAWSVSVPPGTYRIQAQLPPGYRYGPVVGAGNQISASTAQSSAVTVAARGTLATIDVGAIPAPGATTVVGAVGSGLVTTSFPVVGGGTVRVGLEWGAATTLSLVVKDSDGTIAAQDRGSSRRLDLKAVRSAGGLWRAEVSSTGATDYVLTVTDSTSPPATLPPSYSRTIGGTARAESYPSGVDVDAAGVVYLADTGNDAVEAYAPNGTRKWQVGSYGRGSAEFAEPRDVAVTGGKVYVADTGNNRIKVLDAATGAQLAIWSTSYRSIMGISAGVDSSGKAIVIGTEAYPGASAIRIHDPVTGAVIRTIATPTGTGAGQVEEPRDAATDASGRIYVADFRNHRIGVFSATGTWITSFGSLGSGNTQLNGPYGVDVDDAGNIYVADSNNSTVKKFSKTYAYLGQVGSNGSGSGQFFQLRRAVVGSGASPLIYGADLWGNKVEVFDQAGSLVRTLAGKHAPVGGFNKPYGLAITATELLVADTANHRVEKFSFDGRYSSTFGERGFGEDLSGLNWQRDVAVSPTGRIWVADSKNNRLLEFTEAGKATGTALGKLGTANGEFNWPYALSFAGPDLVVADTFNNRVQRLTTSGQVLWTLTGLAKPRDLSVVGDVVYVADSDHHVILRVSASTGKILSSFGAADLHSPDGIVVAPDGAVFVSDTSWHRLVQFDKAGTKVRAFGTRGAASTQFNRPSKLEIRSSAAGVSLYIADTVNDRIQVFTVG